MLRPVEVFNISLILIKMIKYICTSTSIGTGAWAWAWALGHGCEADRHVLTQQRQKSTQIGTSLSIVKKKQYRTSRQWKICIYQLNHIHKWLIFANVFFGCHRVFETIEWNTKSLFSILIVSAGDFQWLNFVQFFHITVNCYLIIKQQRIDSAEKRCSNCVCSEENLNTCIYFCCVSCLTW